MSNLKNLHKMEKEMYSRKELEEELETLKEAFRQYRKTGTVEEWNALRQEAKEHFIEPVISMLDASGFITEWMKG